MMSAPRNISNLPALPVHPAECDASSSPTKTRAYSESESTDALTPISSTSGQPATPSESDTSGSAISEVTAKLQPDLDRKLEALVLAEETVPPRGQSAVDLPTEGPATTSRDPLGFVCAFGFTGSSDEPSAVPRTKGAFIAAIRGEIEGIGMIQRGLQSYQNAINSRKYHTFSPRFLIDQNTATVITLDQLDQITAHLKKIEEEVHGIEDEDEEVREELMEAFRQVQPWVMRTRAILRHCHVFYKINFVLATVTQNTQH
ncbi:uncharacterized protein Z519_11700 [Cladophialophora bantiana CBS 173.52]|uniref:Uncharacterized protein n=1 Tax=Cladophialophora bantiana (strain ATCC 10958 / CBS 173.52 / CDC B-1940 / NIH 8579) TaxID=1442370 RepID=A0A0D2EC70_CLAB1|nr:uncharacterized protein Z519_11700 [Cladophialophora bantiana CBS 173.52]KIW87726.1 hypothetical protein Z519_11700 [Cladophialophora bantiana CBS 173.52]